MMNDYEKQYRAMHPELAQQFHAIDKQLLGGKIMKSPQPSADELRKKIEWALGSSIRAPVGSNKRMVPAKGLKLLESKMQIDRILNLITTRDAQLKAALLEQLLAEQKTYISDNYYMVKGKPMPVSTHQAVPVAEIEKVFNKEVEDDKSSR